jgi:hypothetical protein
VLGLETRAIGAHGAPTYGPAFKLLLEHWHSHPPEREVALHLMFLAWYIGMEPPHLTGWTEALCPQVDVRRAFTDAHDWLLPHGAKSDDAEALYVVGLMARLGPWIIGDDTEWTKRSEAYVARYRELRPNRMDPAVFAGRGAYGDYFMGHAHLPRGI